MDNSEATNRAIVAAAKAMAESNPGASRNCWEDMTEAMRKRYVDRARTVISVFVMIAQREGIL